MYNYTPSPNTNRSVVKGKNNPANFQVIRNFVPDKPPFKIIALNKLDEIIESLSIDLTEVSLEELATYRKSKIPSFVLKIDGKLYYSSIPEDLNLYPYNIMGKHQCAIVAHECRRLSAASDENGGCEKVRNFSQKIEKYPWITIGYETFNTEHNSFVVLNCLHYESHKKNNKKNH